MNPPSPADARSGRSELNLATLIFGHRLANREHENKKLGWFEAAPAMGLDALGSSSYGPEAALTILIPLGALSLAYVGPVIAAIVALLLILYQSYRQTLLAYPTSGGAYAVAKENLGENASLVAASALMIDYVLNVAVGVSAGVGALVSAAPQLHAYTLPLCLVIVAVVTLANLRGTGEAGWLFALPTYVFIASFLGVIGLGVAKTMLAGGAPDPVVQPPPLGPTVGVASAWLLMHAFASGCTAMTGVEAVSNGVGSMKEPVIQNAYRTLTLIVAVLGLLLAGVAYLAGAYDIGAHPQAEAGYQSVLSQLVGAVAGRGTFYWVAMTSLLAILCLSANTSFVGFPRVCRMVAADGFLPRTFAIPGRRLVFTVGILFLSGSACLLLTAFGGITERLIPLFAIGAFLTFTISQAGMVVHWRRNPKGAMGRLVMNAFGAVATGAALVVIMLAKFTEGAWITVAAVPATILLLKGVRSYYRALDEELREDGPIHLDQILPPTVVVVTESWNRLSERAVKFALTISPDVIAVHLVDLEGPETERDEQALRRRWKTDVEEPVGALGLKPPRLILLPARYRQLHGPLLRVVDMIDAEAPERTVTILIPETVKIHWWQHLLHSHRARRLRRELLRHAGPRVTVATVPWRLQAKEG